MGKVKLILVAAMALCLSVALAGIASAAAINCGDCHGSAPSGLPNNADNCNNNARGLHGTHVNYSSATYKKTVASNGKCSYCHPAQIDTHPSATHINGFINITGGNTVNTLHAVGLSETAKTCTNACHKNRAQTAPWGNYTATVTGGIVLSCRACHDDSTAGDRATLTLSFAHKAHLNSNCTTITYGLMGAAANAGCVNCHPDNSGTLDLWRNGKADDGVNTSKKAYPHASDGTNVLAANATVSNNIVTKTGTGTGATCANNCHKNTATVTWGGAIACDACHYYNASPTFSGNSSAVVQLGGSHGKHFKQGIACTSCHATPPDGTHARSLVLSVSGPYTNLRASYLAVVSAGLGYTRPAKTCTTTGSGCHGVGNTTQPWGNPLNVPSCANCHKYPGTSNDWSGTNGHVVRYDAPVVNTHLKASGFDASGATVYATQIGAGGSCNLCHSNGTHRDGAVNVVGNGNGNCSGNFTFGVATTLKRVTCGAVKCHSGKTTPNWY